MARCSEAMSMASSVTYHSSMQGLRFVYWQDGDAWLGYLEDYPDYLTQGGSLSELKEHLRDIWVDVTGGHIPAVRRVGELDVA
jgi:hypothetical protein